MPGWDLLDDDDPPRPAARPAGSSQWSSLDDDEPAPAPTSGWASLDDDATATAPSPSFEPTRPATELPPAELTAAQLTDGEVVWANVSGSTVALGSGQHLYVPAGVPDGIGGWRRARITDAATLRAEIIEVPVARPARNIGHEPTLLFPALPNQPPPRRPPGFPVGEGGDLGAAFEARTVRAREDYERRAALAERDARLRADQAERKAEVEGRLAVERADLRLQQESARLKAEADGAIARMRADADAKIKQAHEYANAQYQQLRSAADEHERAERDRDAARRARDLLMAVAAVGWLGLVLVLFIGG
ncbi:hypothetical protein GCM10022221_64380 [Actinocorallia aurea]